MKKKIFLMLIIVAVFTCLFAISVSAATPDYTKETVTLSDGSTQCALWDTDGDALIWYISGTDGNGANIYSYVKATSDAVDYNCSWSGPSYGVTVNQVGSIKITVNGVTYDKTKIVVLNIKDDVRITSGKVIGGDVNCFRDTFTNSNSIQYAYLPLNFLGFNSASFKSCPNLRYVNLGELTELRGVSGQDFNTGGSVFFSGQTLDLTQTKINTIGDGAFTACKATEIKLPNTVTQIGQWAFQDCTNITEFVVPEGVTSLVNVVLQRCTSLTTVTIPTTLTIIDSNIFLGSNALTTIKYVGEATENYKALIKAAAPNATLEQTTWCEAYNNGDHKVENMTNACVGTCSVCGETFVDHKEETNVTVSISYTDFSVAGTKTITCQNADCGKVVTEEAPALFKLDGFSTPTEYGKKGLALGFEVNEEALSAYRATDKTLTFGAYIVGCEKLGANDVYTFDGAVKADVTTEGVSYFAMKVTGFENGGNDDTKLCLGAYVVENGDVSYLQAGEAIDGCNFLYTTYNLAYANSSNK